MFNESFGSFKNDSTVSVLYRALNCYHIPVSLFKVGSELKAHHDYPSLLSICDFLKCLGIKHSAVFIELEDLIKINQPCITYISSKKGTGCFAFLVSLDKHSVKLNTGYHKVQIMTLKKFRELWNGTCLFFDEDLLISKNDHTKHKREFRQQHFQEILLPVSALLFLLIVFFNASLFVGNEINTFPFITLFVNKVIGVVMCLMLFLFEINSMKYSLIRRFCYISKNINCNATLKSPYSRIYGDIGLAEVGLAYFCGSLILLSMEGSKIYPLLFLFSVLSVPVIVFTLSYQVFSLKKVCPLCLGVQLLLAIEFILLLTQGQSLNSIPFSEALRGILILLLTGLIIILNKVTLIQQNRNEHYYSELLKFKRDPEVFKHKLYNQKKIKLKTGEFPVILGNFNSKTEITAFLSFHCASCRDMFNGIKKILEMNENIKVYIVFSMTGDRTEELMLSEAYKISKEKGTTDAISFLEACFRSSSTIDSFLNNEFIMPEEEIRNICQDNATMFVESGITKVPEILINGYKIPSIYKFEDLESTIDYLLINEATSQE